MYFSSLTHPMEYLIMTFNVNEREQEKDGK